jgi:hypothetical protein
MEQYFSLHGIIDALMENHVGVLHLGLESWKWGQCHKNSHRGYIACTQFVTNLYECFELKTHDLGHLTKLKQFGIAEDLILDFEQLAFNIEGMLDNFFWECFISSLNEVICAQVLMDHPTTLPEASQRDREAQKVVSAQIKKTILYSPPPSHQSLSFLSSSQDSKFNLC